MEDMYDRPPPSLQPRLIQSELEEEMEHLEKDQRRRIREQEVMEDVLAEVEAKEELEAEERAKREFEEAEESERQRKAELAARGALVDWEEASEAVGEAVEELTEQLSFIPNSLDSIPHKMDALFGVHPPPGYEDNSYRQGRLQAGVPLKPKDDEKTKMERELREPVKRTEAVYLAVKARRGKVERAIKELQVEDGELDAKLSEIGERIATTEKDLEAIRAWRKGAVVLQQAQILDLRDRINEKQHHVASSQAAAATVDRFASAVLLAVLPSRTWGALLLSQTLRSDSGWAAPGKSRGSAAHWASWIS